MQVLAIFVILTLNYSVPNCCAAGGIGIAVELFRGRWDIEFVGMSRMCLVVLSVTRLTAVSKKNAHYVSRP